MRGNVNNIKVALERGWNGSRKKRLKNDNALRHAEASCPAQLPGRVEIFEPQESGQQCCFPRGGIVPWLDEPPARSRPRQGVCKGTPIVA